MPPQRLFLRAWPAARSPPLPPPHFLPPFRNSRSNSSSPSGASERLPPLQAPGTKGWRGLASAIRAVEGRTLGGGKIEGADRATEPLVDVVRGVRDYGTGPAAQRGRPGGIVEWRPLQLSRIHACRWHRTVCPNLVRYRRISFSVRAPGQSHCPRYPNPFIPTYPPSHPTCPVVCRHRKPVNDRIVVLEMVHRVDHATSQHAR